MDFETRAIHEGQEPDPATGAIITPIYQTSTYVQEGLGVNKGYDYARSATRRAPRCRPLASLEGGKYGVAYSSGIGRDDDADASVSAGDHVVCRQRHVRRRLPHVLAGLRAKGYAFEFVRRPRQRELAAHLDETKRIVWLETPTNPMLNIVDIRAAADAAHANGVTSSSTTRSPRPTCSSRSRSAPTSSCIRRRSTSAATPTSSAASSPRTTRRIADRLYFLQNPRARCRARSTAVSCCAA